MTGKRFSLETAPSETINDTETQCKTRNRVLSDRCEETKFEFLILIKYLLQTKNAFSNKLIELNSSVVSHHPVGGVPKIGLLSDKFHEIP